MDAGLAPEAAPVFDARFRRELAALFRWRRDVRRFRRDPLPPGLLDALIAMLGDVPSVGLSQPWRIVSVESASARAAIAAVYAAANAEALAAQPGERAGHYARLKLAGLAEAPCQLAIFIDPDPAQGGGLGRRTMPEAVGYSAVLAVHHLWLAARAEGLGLGWVSILDPLAVGEALDVPGDWRLVAYLCLGWPAQEADVPELEREGWERRREPMVLRR